MKTCKKLFCTIILALISLIVGAQTVSVLPKQSNHDFLISVSGGYDISLFQPKKLPYPYITPEIAALQPGVTSKFKGGLYLGAGFDYYWKWIGLGAEFNYIQNKLDMNVVYDYIGDFHGDKYYANDRNITRMFYGVGPNFRYQLPNRKFSVELNTRVGMSPIKGGKIHLMAGYDEFYDESSDFNHHIYIFNGLDAKNLLSLKGQLRFTYFFHEVVGLSVGAYYMHHFKVPYQEEYAYLSPDVEPLERELANLPAVKGNYGSVGVFGGLTIRLSPKKKAPKPAPVVVVPPAPAPAPAPKPAPAPVPGKIILNGKVVICGESTPVPGAAVVITNNNNNKENIILSDNSGKFSLPIPANTSFTIHAKKENYFSSMTTIPSQPVQEKDITVDVEICMEQMKRDVSIRLNNIHYDLDRAEIRPDAYPELNRVVQFLKDNPDARIELSSHTDSRGSDAYNLDLSQRRAESAKAYIVSQGIDPSRIVSVGYGESRLLNRCKDGVDCSEEEHQLNRRTEMKIINFE